MQSEYNFFQVMDDSVKFEFNNTILSGDGLSA